MNDPMQYLVAFTLKGCPHCANVPELLRSVEALAPSRIIDATDRVCSVMNISSFPTLVLVNPALTFVYKGERTPTALRAWIVQKMLQTTTYIEQRMPQM